MPYLLSHWSWSLQTIREQNNYIIYTWLVKQLQVDRARKRLKVSKKIQPGYQWFFSTPWQNTCQRQPKGGRFSLAKVFRGLQSVMGEKAWQWNHLSQGWWQHDAVGYNLCVVWDFLGRNNRPTHHQKGARDRPVSNLGELMSFYWW